MNRCQVYYTRGSIPFLGTSIVGFVAGILLPFAALAVENAATNSDDSTTLPPGIVDTQNPNDASLSVAESLARIKVPDGFRVTLFAGEPDIRRPIAMSMDDRGRLWVVENYSHPNWQPTGQDRVVILEDQDGGTLLTLHHTGFSGLRGAMTSFIMEKGWRKNFLSRMDELLRANVL